MEDIGNKKQEPDGTKENHLKILGMKHIVIATKNSMDRRDSRMVTAEESIYTFNDEVEEPSQKPS